MSYVGIENSKEFDTHDYLTPITRADVRAAVFDKWKSEDDGDPRQKCPVRFGVGLYLDSLGLSERPERDYAPTQLAMRTIPCVPLKTTKVARCPNESVAADGQVVRNRDA